MPKRSYEEKLDHYMKKMEKLREKYRSKRRRDSSPLSSDQDYELDKTQGVEADTWDLTEPLPGPAEAAPLHAPDENDPHRYHSSQFKLRMTRVFQPLDPVVLSALGEATDQGPTWGQDIHINLTQLWEPLLKKGMAKEIKDKIL